MIKIKENIPIRNQVLEQLRNLILTNEITSGERLREEKLASEIGVSRTPIREALHILEREGFLEAIPRVGYVVKTPKIEDFDEIVEIRKALEPLTAIFAAKRLNPSIKKELMDNIKKSKEVINRGNNKKFSELNQEFHAIIDNASGKRWLQEINTTLRNYMLFYRISNILNKEMAKTSIIQHENIVKAIMSKSEEKIRKTICSDLDVLKKSVLDHFFENGKYTK